MRSVVTGLMMLAGAAVREKGHGFDDFGWRREVQQAREAQEADAATSGNGSGDGRSEVRLGRRQRWWPGRTDRDGRSRLRGALMSVEATEDDDAAPGDWDVACEREAGNRLVFDRGSVREMGGATLFRWAPAGGVAPQADGTIYTAVADCREKSIEASWPGKRQRDARRAPAGVIWSTRSARRAAPSKSPSRALDRRAPARRRATRQRDPLKTRASERPGLLAESGPGNL